MLHYYSGFGSFVAVMWLVDYSYLHGAYKGCQRPFGKCQINTNALSEVWGLY